MNVYEWILLGIYAVLLTIMVVQKALRRGPIQRGVVKTLLSACFFGGAIYGYVQNKAPVDIILVIGLAFAMLGDLLLIFMEKRKPFVAGVYSFACASITLTVYSVVKYTFAWWSLFIFALITTAVVIAQRKKVFSFGKNFVHLNIYTLCVALCGSLGISLLFCNLATPGILFGVGCFLYFVSDVLLGLYLFSIRKPAVDCANSLTYFPGMLLVALSLLIL